MRSVPLYEYRCRTCDERFDARRAMADADAPVACPNGHTDAVRLLAAFAATGRSAGAPAASAPMPAGGGCGAGCACVHG